MTELEFINKVKELGIEVTNEKLKLLEVYAKFLLEYNEHTNLTAIKEIDDIYLKHFYDSLTICKIIDLNKENSLLDIGSGAGFPGMVLKIFFPHLYVVLVDSNNKKTKFLLELKEKFELEDIDIINDRIENIAKTKLNSFDVVTARAVTNLPVLVELAMPLVKKNKYFIAMKGNAKEELENSLYAIEVLNGKIVEIKEFDLIKNAGKRTIIKIAKLKESKKEELRPYDKIIKKPLQKKSK